MLVIGLCNRSVHIMYARCCRTFLGVNFVVAFFFIYFCEHLFSTDTWILLSDRFILKTTLDIAANLALLVFLFTHFEEKTCVQNPYQDLT